MAHVLYFDRFGYFVSGYYNNWLLQLQNRFDLSSAVVGRVSCEYRTPLVCVYPIKKIINSKTTFYVTILTEQS